MGWLDIGISIVKDFISPIAKAGDILHAVADILTYICKKLGILPSDIQEEEMGDKAIQAKDVGITPEKFDTYQEYLKVIQDFKIDPEKSHKISTEAKLAKAMELEVLFLKEAKPEMAVLSFLGIIARHMEYFSPEKVDALGKMLVSANDLIVNIDAVLNKGEKNPEKIEAAYEKLADIEKQIDPGISDEEALNRALKIE